MSPALPSPESLSLTEAAERGVSAIVRAAGEGHEIVVERHGQAIAAVVSMRRLGELAELEADLRSAALVLTRLVTDDGRRTDLDDVIAAFGFDRGELEAELDADPAIGRG
jgi:antitoxin (DNA-binding transcriptional repressor) of toxin-antitoxin stability system